MKHDLELIACRLFDAVLHKYTLLLYSIVMKPIIISTYMENIHSFAFDIYIYIYIYSILTLCVMISLFFSNRVTNIISVEFESLASLFAEKITGEVSLFLDFVHIYTLTLKYLKNEYKFDQKIGLIELMLEFILAFCYN